VLLIGVTVDPVIASPPATGLTHHIDLDGSIVTDVRRGNDMTVHSAQYGAGGPEWQTDPGLPARLLLAVNGLSGALAFLRTTASLVVLVR
jgi:hypothetical protein